MINLLKKPFLLLIILFILLITLITNCFLDLLAFSDSSYNFEKKEKTTLYPGKPVYQKFTAKENNLSQIKIALGDTDKLGWRDKIILELANENCEQLIAVDNVYAWTLMPQIFYRFNFNIIPDSQNKTYCLLATFSPQDKNQKNRPHVRTGLGPDIEGMSFVNDGKNKEYPNESIMMRPAYKSNDFKNNVITLNQRISQYKPDFLKNNYLWIISISFLLATFLLVILLIFL